MKKLLTIALAMLLITAVLAGCGQAPAPKYENLLVTTNTVECDRFGMKYAVSDEFAVLTDDILQLTGEVDTSICTGETYKVGDEEIPLRTIAMVSDFMDGEYITFTTQKLDTEMSLPDHIDQIMAELENDISFSGLQEIKLLGADGYSFSFKQNYEGSSYYNVGYLVQNGDYLLTIMCSGAKYPENTLKSIESQFVQ